MTMHIIWLVTSDFCISLSGQQKLLYKLCMNLVASRTSFLIHLKRTQIHLKRTQR